MPLPSAGRRRRIIGAATAYPSVLALTPVLAIITHHMWSNGPTFRGQPPSVFVAYACVLVAAGLWLVGRPALRPPNEERLPGLGYAMLAALAALWAVSLLLSVQHGDLFDLTALLPPVILAMLWFGPPTRGAALRGLDVWGLGIVAIAIIAMALDFIGLRTIDPQGIIRWPGEVLRLLGFDPLTSVPGEQIDACRICYGFVGRWEGPFGNVNTAGPLGATVLMLGLLRAGWRRWTLAIGGALIVILSDSRTALIAIAFGVLAWILCAPAIGHWRVRTWQRWLALAIAVTAAVGYVGVIDRDLNLRTEVWGSFLRSWTTSPWIGVGGSGIGQLIEAGRLPGWASHGHSLPIDGLLRYGLGGLLLVLALFTVLVTLALRSARRGEVLPIVLITTAIGAALTEDLLDWRYWSLALVPLVLAGIVAARTPPPAHSDVRASADSLHSPTTGDAPIARGGSD